jgi:lipopolysaccharide/colanic/teichoic acid biosynthesis glycosyltransferase
MHTGTVGGPEVSVRSAIRAGYLAAVVSVVLGLGKFHASAVGNYDLTAARTFPWFLVFTAMLCLAGYVAGLPDRVPTPQRAFYYGTLSTSVCVLLLAGLQAVVGAPLLPRFVLGAAPLFVIPLGVLAAAVSQWSYRHNQRVSRAVVVADRDEQARLMADLSTAGRLAVSIVSCLTTDEAAMVGEEHLMAVAEQTGATLIVLSRVAQNDDRIVGQAAKLHAKGVRIRTLSKFYEDYLAKLPVAELERISLMFDISDLHPGVYPRFKRSLDLVVGVLGVLSLVAIAPLVAVANVFGNRGPLIYRQPRVGRQGEVFSILKFRSMRPGGGATTWTQEHDDRVTPIGRLLRKSHLDELPQMINIVRGDLSIVGPRPEQPAYVEELSGKLPFYDLRHLVRPGLTGWAQVNYGYGGSESDALEKLQYEFFYMRHQSLRLDLIIMVQTARRIFATGNR